MSNPFVNGVYTVLPTPFKEDGTYDHTSFIRLLDKQLQNDKISAIVLLGTTAEAMTLSEDEKLMICHDVYSQKTKLGIDKFTVVGIGGNDTNAVIKFGKKVRKYADAFMVTVPNYNRPPQKGIEMHFVTIANAFPDVPIVMYNIPKRTGINMEPETMQKVIQQCSNVKALKEASGNIDDLRKVVEYTKGIDFKIFSGDDGRIDSVISEGGHGVMSVMSNILPDFIASICNKSLGGEYDVITPEVMAKYNDFSSFLFSETNPIAIKSVLCSAKIFDNAVVRLPLVELEDDVSDTLSSKLHEIL